MEPPTNGSALECPTGGIGTEKIDPITALQEGIDGLSLAMFEALRGLRDAVAPESGNLGNNNTNNANNAPDGSGSADTATTTEPDVEELWQLYCDGDAGVAAMVQKSGSSIVIRKREHFVQWHAEMERDKDAELVEKLAAAVLLKSEQIDEQVTNLPGMNRTRADQMKYIQNLIEENETLSQELGEVYKNAAERRDDCRKFVREQTSTALGIEEEF